ncbi:MAG: hypothetical protein Q8N98_01655 [bacterium]|nr:hypothetical protein [bacterium]
MSTLIEWLREKLTRSSVSEAGEARKVRVTEDVPGDRFVLIVALMIIFFAGLVGLEIVHMVVFGAWNESVFNGVMLIVGTIVGAVWGRSEA